MPGYAFTWRGEAVTVDILDALASAFDDYVVPSAEEMIRDLTPVRTGFLRDSTYVFTDTTNAQQPTLVMGQAADYALYVELGTRFMDGSFHLTQAAFAMIDILPQAISEALTELFPGRKEKTYQVGLPSTTQIVVEGGPTGGEQNPYTQGPLTFLLPDALSEAPLNP